MRALVVKPHPGSPCACSLVGQKLSALTRGSVDRSHPGAPFILQGDRLTDDTAPCAFSEPAECFFLLGDGRVGHIPRKIP